MQGQLREQPLAVTIHTECACCKQPLMIHLDSELNYTIPSSDAQPLVFVPLVDFTTLEDPSIIDAF